MSAQPIHEHQPPIVPNTIDGIRQHLPQSLRGEYQRELDAAMDSGSMARVDEVKGRWWAQAWLNTDPSIREDFAAADRGELALVPDPFAR